MDIAHEVRCEVREDVHTAADCHCSPFRFLAVELRVIWRSLFFIAIDDHLNIGCQRTYLLVNIVLTQNRLLIRIHEY